MRPQHLKAGLGFVLVLVLHYPCLANDRPTPSQVEFFESYIRPVLVEHCYECHNSASAADGGLVLDHRAAMRKGGENGPIVIPGKPELSRLIPILRHEVDGLEMPQGSPQLSTEVIARFEQWIAMGAPDPRSEPPSAQEVADALSWETKLQQRKQWWSFQPIRQVSVPDVSFPSGGKHPVDRFIHRKLSKAGLQPAPTASSNVLVRRLYSVLIGLPPSHSEARSWIAKLDGAPPESRQAIVEELVDALLASPHFGERWARHWMDWVRYAESHGSEGDPANDNAWMYRDYLIRALNADVPYDQLLREHVAGDLLSQPRVNHELGLNESAIGPAHLRMVFHGFAPTDALDEKVRFTDDQINAFSKAFMGLTISCARCHDHKFDAISHQDYYAFFGIFGSTRPGRTVVDLPERLSVNRLQLKNLKPRIRRAIADDWLSAVASLADRLTAEFPAGKEIDQPQSVLHPLSLLRKQLDRDVPFEQAWAQRVASFRTSREKPASDATPDTVQWNLASEDDYARWFPSGNGLPRQPQLAGEFAVTPQGDEALTGIYPQGVYSHLVSSKDAARLTSPNFAARGGSELWLEVIGDSGATVRYVVQNYPRSGTVYPVPKLNNNWRWQRFDLSYWDGDEVHVELTTARDAPLLVQQRDRSWFGVRRARIIPKGAPHPADSLEHVAPIFDAAVANPPLSLRETTDLYQRVIIAAINAWKDETLSDSQALLLDACLRQQLLPNTLASLPVAEPLLREYRRLEADVPTPTRVPGLEETIGRNQRLYERGNHKLPRDEVPRRFLEAIDATPYDTALSGRLELANDLLRDDNPFPRRVIVNRLWHHVFGSGIVSTPDNFGRLGNLPSHPELLDWLSNQLPERGWSLKSVIRLMVTSQTWQQSSSPSDGAREIDPDNRLLSHANVRRLDAEAIRDALLSVSGQLDRQVFGPPVGGSAPRRSVYVQVIRNSLDPFLSVFDFPEPFSTVGRRNVTNVPAQSLTLLNDPRISRDAAAWVKQILNDPNRKSTEQRIDEMFMAAFSRSATSAELSRAKQFLSDVDEDLQTRRHRLAQLNAEATSRQQQVSALLEPVRARLLAAMKQQAVDVRANAPAPMARWDFTTDAIDSIGVLHGELRGGATVSGGALIVSDGGYMVTAPLTQPLRAKTLEAWVQLDNLDQRGGGVMSVQTQDGVTFDAIVFGERAPGEWLSGSNNFARTQDAGGPPEHDAVQQPVHVALAYHADGLIACYRNGQPYGKPYRSSGPVEFPARDTVVSFGVRHLPAVGNRLLSGKILKAQLYDRALTDTEVAASSQVLPTSIPDERLLAELSDEDRQRVTTWRQELGKIQTSIADLGDVPTTVNDALQWTELARALFTFKEFIYVR